MPEFDPSRFDQLVAAVRSRPADELVADIQASPGGIDGVLRQVLTGMTSVFDPARAAGEQAEVQYEITAPDGTHTYWMRVADGACSFDAGPASNPRCTLRIGMADFLKLVAGSLNPMQALMTGRLKVSGDLFFLQKAQGWFTRPAV